MYNILKAIEIAEKLTEGQIKVLKWFVRHKEFEGSYRALADAIYQKPQYASNVRRYVKELEEKGLVCVATDDDCGRFDSNRTHIFVSEEV